MLESFPGSLAERQRSGGDTWEAARKGVGVLGDVGSFINAARYLTAISATIWGGKEVVESFDGEPGNSFFSEFDDGVENLFTNENLMQWSALGLVSAIVAYLCFSSAFSKKESSSSRPTHSPSEFFPRERRAA